MYVYMSDQLNFIFVQISSENTLLLYGQLLALHFYDY